METVEYAASLISSSACSMDVPWGTPDVEKKRGETRESHGCGDGDGGGTRLRERQRKPLERARRGVEVSSSFLSILLYAPSQAGPFQQQRPELKQT